MMSSQSPGDEARWLLTPLEPQEVRIFIAVADDADLTPAMRAALEQLASAMQTDEAQVQGYCASHLCRLIPCDRHVGGIFMPGLLQGADAPALSFGLFKI
jgi:hypothetical protein